MTYCSRDRMVEIVVRSSAGPPVRPINTVEPRLWCDETVVGEDDDANRTDFTSSRLLPRPALIFDGRRDE